MLNKNANESYELLLGIYHSLCEEYIPKRKKGKRKEPKWMIDEIKFEIREKHRIWYRMKASNTSKLR